MKKIIVLLSLITFGLEAQSSHIPGGNLTYECVSTNPTVLLVKAQIYVGCASIGLPGVNLQISNDCGLTNPPGALSLVDTTKVSWVCSSVISECDGGAIPEWVRYNFEGLITLADTCDSWKFSWTHCCRPGSANLANVGDVYLETIVNTTQFNCENSPEVQGQEIPYFCSGMTQNYCIPAYDVDGDSLYFELTDARMSGGTPIPYLVPYSASQPLQNLSIDGNTGCITFNQATVGMFHVAVRINSYNNGVHIGYVTQDFPIMIISCINSAPSGAISNVTGAGVQTGQNTIDACVNQSVCFDIAFTDPNTGDTIIYDTILSNLALAYPGATINSSGMNPMIVSICWTPTNLGFYYGSTFVNDNYCPLQGVGSFTSIIHVTTCTPVGIDVSISSTINIHPNPTSGQISISLEEARTGVLRVLNSLVQIVLEDAFKGVNEIDISLDGPSGIYFLQLEIDGELITKKVVKE